MQNYESFIANKSQVGGDHGFDPISLPDWLFDFQRHLVTWALRKGRAAIFADCGMGKTPMQLVWADNVRRKTGKPVLILTPLAIKFSIDAKYSPDGKLSSGIVISNYERLHHFDPTNFSGVVCDESSILKSFNGATRKAITRFMSKMPYRLLCTATAAPNDYIELGNSSEALGELSYSDMLRRFFVMLDDKGQKRERRIQDESAKLIKALPSYYKKLAFRVSQTIGQWRLKNHAVQKFWQWVASWAKACRMPADLGYSNDGFILPELDERDHIIHPQLPPEGMLFTMPAFGLSEERAERRRTLNERCEFVAELVKHDRPAVVWCHLNCESDMLAEVIPDAEQIAGRTPDELKVKLYDDFAAERLRVLVIKPKIGAWGLNWQHCNHVVTFATHSYEQYYQSMRRCYRYGQLRPVRLDVIATEGEARVLENMRSKAHKADAMFAALVREMNNAQRINRENEYTDQLEVPQWL
jgi:hypothetical protein